MKPTKQNPKTICVDCEHVVIDKVLAPCMRLSDDLHLCSARRLTERRHYVTGEPVWFDEIWAEHRESKVAYLLCKDENDGNCSRFKPVAVAEVKSE